MNRPVHPSDISVVIATLRRPDALQRCLASLAALRESPARVFVVDNTAGDSATAAVARQAGATLLVEPRPGLSRARNRGARAALPFGGAIAFLDDDVVVEDGWAAAIAAGFATDPEVMIVTGRILPIDAEGDAAHAYAATGGLDLGPTSFSIDAGDRYWFERTNFGEAGFGGNIAIRAEAFAIWPGFRESLGLGAPLHGAEEQHALFSIARAGGRVTYRADAVTYHAYPASFADLKRRHLRDLERVGAYCLLLLVEEPEHRGAVLRYAYEGAFRRPRTWRRPQAKSYARLSSRAEDIAATVRGVGLYLRARARETARRSVVNVHPRVLAATVDFPPSPGGIQRLVERVTQHSRYGPVVVVAPHQAGDREFDATQTRIEVVRAPTSARSGKWVIAAVNISTFLEAWRRRPDALLAAHIMVGPGARLASGLLGIPYVQVLHADEVPAHPGFARLAVGGARRIIVVSRHTRRLALAVGADPQRIRIVHPGVDLPASPPSPGRAPGPATVVTVARLADRYKGHDVMLEAMVRVREHVADARWVVIGDGPLRAELVERRDALGLDGAVDFRGRVTDDELQKCLDAAHVFAMPSRLPKGEGGEGFGIVYVEAAAHGLPVVAGNVAGAVDAVQRDAGLLVDPTDPEAVASALVELLTDPVKARSLGEAGRRRAETLAWPLVAERFDDVLAEVIP